MFKIIYLKKNPKTKTKNNNKKPAENNLNEGFIHKFKLLQVNNCKYSR